MERLKILEKRFWKIYCFSFHTPSLSPSPLLSSFFSLYLSLSSPISLSMLSLLYLIPPSFSSSLISLLLWRLDSIHSPIHPTSKLWDMYAAAQCHLYLAAGFCSSISQQFPFQKLCSGLTVSLRVPAWHLRGITNYSLPHPPAPESFSTQFRPSSSFTCTNQQFSLPPI